MERHQVTPSVPSLYALGHRAPRGVVSRLRGIAVSTYYPDNRLIPVALAQELAVDRGILRREHLRAGSPLQRPHLVAPRRQQTDVQPKLRGPVHDPIHMLEVALGRTGGVQVLKRHVPVPVRHGQPVELGDAHHLDDGVPLARPVPEVQVHLIAVEPLEQRPARIPEVEERGVVLLHEEAPVFTDLEHPTHSSLPCLCAGSRALGSSSQRAPHPSTLASRVPRYSSEPCPG